MVLSADMTDFNSVFSLPQQHDLSQVFSAHNVQFAKLFGSYAKGNATKKSDFDFVIEFLPQYKASLFDIVNVKMELEDVLQSHVDITTPRALHPLIKDDVLSHSISVYGHQS